MNAEPGPSELVGIYGGRFDPIHFGHLRTALEIWEALQLSELRFMPCGYPPHRSPPAATGAQRRRMLELALDESCPGWLVDTRELDRGGPSYMVDTLTSLREQLGDVPLCLILGQDAVLELHTWHRWTDLFALTHLLVVSRPDIPDALPEPRVWEFMQSRLTTEPSDLRRSSAGKVYGMSLTQLAISATQIRSLIAKGSSARFLLPDAVLSFIFREGLYGTPRPCVHPTSGVRDEGFPGELRG